MTEEEFRKKNYKRLEKFEQSIQEYEKLRREIYYCVNYTYKQTLMKILTEKTELINKEYAAICNLAQEQADESDPANWWKYGKPNPDKWE